MFDTEAGDTLHGGDDMGSVMRMVWAVLNFTVGEGDDKVVKLRKNILMVFYPSIVVVNSVVYFVIQSQLGKVTAMALVAVTLVFWTHLISMKRINITAVQLYIAFLSVGVACYDVVTASENTNRAWPLQVMLIDTLLMLRADKSFCRGLVALFVLYLTCTALEGALRLGLFDIPGLLSQEERVELHTCPGDNIPCRNVALAFQDYCNYIMVFLMDYYVTKGFAEQLFQKTLQVESSVRTAEKIAKALAAFDLDEAEHYLNGSDQDLPVQLRVAYESILKNLTLYRPFLPDALFEEVSQFSMRNPLNPLSRGAAPPGVSPQSDNKAALVFTDIQGSTSIWEACPDGMKRALKLHNKTIRKLIETFKGYEVKTIGDSFMVAFGTPVEAVDFSLAVQNELLSSAWPYEILELPSCEKTRDGLWGGLRVRAGVHYGEVDVELDSITGRFDYFGSTVNVAARVEAVAVGGAVAITPEVSDALSQHYSMKENRLQYCRVPIGSKVLKGVSKTTQICLLLPEELKGRRTFVEAQIRQRNQADRHQPDMMRRTNSAWSLRSPSETTASHTHESSRRSVNLMASTESSMKQFALEYLPSVSVASIDILVDNNEVAAGADLTGINDRVCKVLHSLDRCGGTVITLLGSMITAGWNTSKATSTHFESSLRFTSLIHKMFYNDDVGVHVGVASGGAASATIGTLGQRFVTVIGDAVKLSMLLASAAAEFETSVLLTSCTPQQFTNVQEGVRGVLRPIATWQTKSPHEHSFRPKVIYEVSVPRLTNIDLTKLIKYDDSMPTEGDPQARPWGWCIGYWDAFKKRDTELIAANAASDRTAIIAARVLHQDDKRVYL